jgi:hypothetical protein
LFRNNPTLYSYVKDINSWIDPCGLSGFIPKVLTSGSVFRSLGDNNLFSPSVRDLTMFNKTGNMPGFSTFLNGDGVKALTRNGKAMFDTVAEIDISKLGPNLVAELDSAKGHVSIKPSANI